MCLLHPPCHQLRHRYLRPPVLQQRTSQERHQPQVHQASPRTHFSRAWASLLPQHLPSFPRTPRRRAPIHSTASRSRISTSSKPCPIPHCLLLVPAASRQQTMMIGLSSSLRTMRMMMTFPRVAAQSSSPPSSSAPWRPLVRCLRWTTPAQPARDRLRHPPLRLRPCHPAERHLLPQCQAQVLHRHRPCQALVVVHPPRLPYPQRLQQEPFPTWVVYWARSKRVEG